LTVFKEDIFSELKKYYEFEEYTVNMFESD